VFSRLPWRGNRSNLIPPPDERSFATAASQFPM